MPFSWPIYLQEKWNLFRRFPKILLCVILLIVSIGFVGLYSAAGGNLYPWVSRQGIRLTLGLGLMGIVAITDIRFWCSYAYPLHALAVALLIGVELMGFIGMGAQRWIDLYIFNCQPSEIVRLTLVLALARYFHMRSSHKPLWTDILFPITLMAIPVLLVLRQPDLGTALVLLASGLSIFWVAGVSWRLFTGGILAFLGSIPILWRYLHDYQKKRILVFLDPESDPLNAGYHILQSKIAIGSGGLMGKGFLQGTQSHLNFLPEKQTDFIFALLSEEWGIFPGILLILFYSVILAINGHIAFECRSLFSRYVVTGLATSFFIYVVTNMGMVMGLLPVVGVPLPLVSYGGTALLTVMMSQGFIVSAYVYRDIRVGRWRGL